MQSGDLVSTPFFFWFVSECVSEHRSYMPVSRWFSSKMSRGQCVFSVSMKSAFIVTVMGEKNSIKLVVRRMVAVFK